LERGLDQVHEEALSRARQALDALHLLEQLGRRAALAWPRLLAGQILDRDAERAAELHQQRDRDPEPPDLVVRQGLLRHAKLIGELLLAEIVALARLGDAPAERAIELLLRARHENVLEELNRYRLTPPPPPSPRPSARRRRRRG